MDTLQRHDGTHYQVADAARRGDRCFKDRTGWYWYDYDEQWAIVEKSVTGPYPSRHAATMAGLRRENIDG